MYVAVCLNRVELGVLQGKPGKDGEPGPKGESVCILLHFHYHFLDSNQGTVCYKWLKFSSLLNCLLKVVAFGKFVTGLKI